MLRKFLPALALTGVLHAGIDLRLPTENHHLFSGEPDQFFMYVERHIDGKVSKDWEGGTFGFVRDAIRINDQLVFTHMHEGIDIKPLNRDNAGNPLDLVSSIADGRVVHVSPIAGRSNYGKYIVIEHTWENSSVYSLYAHLSEINCKPEDQVKAGTVIGHMGFTGAGIDRTRAHCHLEIAMMMSEHYDDWHKSGGAAANYHGVYNGMNLTGADAARFYVEQKANPELRFSEFIASTPVYFKVTVPSKGTPDFVTRYPWICHGKPEGAASWEISFSATGMPVAFTPSERVVESAIVSSVRPSRIPHRYLTRNLVSGQEEHATLTAGGKQLVALLTDDFPITKEQAMERKPLAPKS